MKAVILAGGLGTRISEESLTKPKPMIEIGNKPILWHIMKQYSHFGINDFIICCGYKGNMIKEYFFNYSINNSDFTVNLNDNSVNIHQTVIEPWTITLIDTGFETMTGGRILRIKDALKNEKDFCLTYGDGVGNVSIDKLIEFHRNSGLKATLTGSYPSSRFGTLEINGDKVINFKEKPAGDRGRVNSGFFVFNQSIFSYLENDSTILERKPLESLAKEGQLGLFCHDDFWQPMDTLRDKMYLQDLWNLGNAPWKIWK